MATPYLGSKISLISKSEIRYEGVLYTIDTRESTIALANVRSFGTENRPADKYVAPREEVFEYIIFRANDIKDLIVDDPPPASITQALGDPAIIQAQSSMPSSSTTLTKPSLSGAPSAGLNGPSQLTVSSTTAIAPPTSRPVGSIANMPVFTSASAGSQSSLTSGPPPAGPAFGGATTSSMGFRSGGSSPTGAHRRSPVSESGGPKMQSNSRDDKASKNHLSNNRDSRNQNYRDNYRVSGVGGDRRQGPPPQYGRRPMPGQQLPPSVHNMNFRGRGRQGPPLPPSTMMGPPKRGPMMGGRAPPQPRPQYNRGPITRNVKPTTSLKIEDDFDFEKANKEFEELENKLSKVKLEDNEKKEEETGSTQQSPQQPHQQQQQQLVESDDKSAKDEEKKEDEDYVFYDKAKSFFDKISCEALERSKGKVSRIDWRQERKMNAETFGLTANNFRRGGYRGRGGFNRDFSRYPGQNYNGNRNFNQRLGGRSYGSNSSDRRVNQPREISW